MFGSFYSMKLFGSHCFDIWSISLLSCSWLSFRACIVIHRGIPSCSSTQLIRVRVWVIHIWLKKTRTAIWSQIRRACLFDGSSTKCAWIVSLSWATQITAHTSHLSRSICPFTPLRGEHSCSNTLTRAPDLRHSTVSSQLSLKPDLCISDKSWLLQTFFCISAKSWTGSI